MQFLRRDAKFLFRLCQFHQRFVPAAAAFVPIQQSRSYARAKPADEKQIVEFERQHFSAPEGSRTKDVFINAVMVFAETRGGKRGKGHVEFIKAALKHMKEYGLHKDLDTYKALLNVFPKGVMIPTNVFQKVFMHFPDQQITCVQILDQMEWFGVYPDKEVFDIVANAFGQWNFATKKIRRMLYWMPKLKHTNRYLDRRDVEFRNLSGMEMARVTLKTICRDAGTQFAYFKTKPVDEQFDYSKWIVSAQSPLQRRLISTLPSDTCYFVDGPSQVYLLDNTVQYCVLSSRPSTKIEEDVFIDQRSFHDYPDYRSKLYAEETDPSERNIHQQADQTILALCVMEENSQRMATAWIDHLAEKNPKLGGADVLFRIREVDGNEGDKEEMEGEKRKSSL